MMRDHFPCSVGYLDSAASSLTLNEAVEAMAGYYAEYRANIHRGVYAASRRAGERYEWARGRAAAFIGAAEPSEVVFTAGATDSINTVAAGWPEMMSGERRVLVASEAEHHSNLLPWQRAAARSGGSLRLIPVRPDGALDLSRLEEIITEECSLVAVTALSNVTGEVTDLERICAAARKAGAAVLVDAAQAAGRIPLDVRASGIDFLAFSGHKCYGPTGIGILYGRRELLERLPPLRLGGGMVSKATGEDAVFAPLPARFEGGTPNIAGAIGLGTALDVLLGLGMEKVQRHENGLTALAVERLLSLGDARVIAPSRVEHTGVVSFNIEGVHPHDALTVMEAEGLALRGGLHCAEPLHTALELGGSIRASFGIYTEAEEIELLVRAVEKVRDFFSA